MSTSIKAEILSDASLVRSGVCLKKKPQFAKSGHSGKVTPRSERAMFRETTRTQEVHLRLYSSQLAC